ncbi:parallel beta-helix repeat (two copies) [Belliella buryatensis]|uniref:Parallel beta-helix repeat (Two copies) n=1 Tax=Belliella buryatensis TaxID=1500549 RepID=A0A239EUN3_9BACT|nr:right-handed parallel beta-helix repeat-containing protein [Belliella buryatensis]SNS47988.1 parallel beta-helix repeat (two copies) [Belliella buryatensis]
MNHFGLLRILALIPAFMLVQKLHAQDFRLSNYLNENEKDVTLAVLTMLQDASEYKDSKVIIEEGVYHFYPEKAYEQYSFVSNHDNTMRRIAFPIKGFDGLTLQASGAKFIFHGLMMPFLIEDSKNVDISGFSIDWHIPLHSEALVVANDQENGSVDLKIAESFPYTIRNEKLIFIKEGYEHDLGNAILYDPLRKAVAYNTNDYTPLRMNKNIEIKNKHSFDFQNYVDLRSPEYVYQNQENILKAEELAHGLVRISGLSKSPPPVGMVLVAKGQNGDNRTANAIHINKSQDIKIHDVTIYHAGGMGVIGERSINITLDNMKIFPNPERDLMVSTTADASHFVNCKGEIIINNCNFRNQLDDATNVHGSYVIVSDVLSPNKIGVRVGHFQQGGFDFAEAGDKIGFINQKKSANIELKTTVQHVNKLNERYYIITLSENIASQLNDDYVVENLDWYPELTITNNHFADNRARGILLSTPKKTIVRNNYFSNMMSAIFVPVELTWWYESGSAQDLLIEGNTFGDCAYGGGDRPVIYIETDLDKTDYIFGNITIKNNTFTNFNPSILKANGVRYLEFSDNKIENSKSFPALYPSAHVLDVHHIDTLIIKNIDITVDFQNKLKAIDVINKVSNM